jgi:regulatory protein
VALLVRIETAGPERKARRLVFNDGMEPRVTSKAAVKQLGLVENTRMDVSTLEQALKGCEYDLAKEKALQLLGYRERSCAELVRKLQNAGYPRSVCLAVTERFSEVQLVDDARFAGMWVRTRRASGYGSRRISRELHEKGIAEDVIETALAQQGAGADQLEAARTALRGRTPRDRADGNRLVRRLISRGFTLNVALEAVGQPADPDSED